MSQTPLLIFSFLLIHYSLTQQIGTYTPEIHPPLPWSLCTSISTCSPQNGSITADANWRYNHIVNNSIPCYDAGWTDTDGYCTDSIDCGEKCALDGAEYENVLGMHVTGDDVRLKYLLHHDYAVTIDSRVFLMQNDTTYQTFNLLNKEISFDVNVSTIPCGVIASFYLVSMDSDGGTSRYSGNKAGSSYGTGYCDGKCPRYEHFVNGMANKQNWTELSSLNPGSGNTGYGLHGSCCTEIDIFQGNKISTAMAAHPCYTSGQQMCNGNDCKGLDSSNHSASILPAFCDTTGCTLNPYTLNITSFYGPSPAYTVNTNTPFKIITQFPTDSSGSLTSINRVYIQNSTVIPSPSSSSLSSFPSQFSSLTSSYCTTSKQILNQENTFQEHGGMSALTEAMERGMVLVMSLQDDRWDGGVWLDGGGAGTCGEKGVWPGDLTEDVWGSEGIDVRFGNIMVGGIGMTF